MNRRDFLYSGTALGLTATAGMSARSYGAISGANDRVGLGVIGVGRQGTVDSKAFAKDPRVRFVALCDIYDEQVRQFQGALQGHLESPAISVRHQDLLSRKDVDAVLISTPDHLHVEIAKDALDAGKNIYMEKPTLHRWHERSTLEQAAARSKQVIQCGMQQRSGSHYMRAKDEIVSAGKLGHVVLVRAAWCNFPWQRRIIPSQPKPPGLHWELFLGPAPKVPYETARYSSWRSYHDYGNGLLADILTHWVDVAQWFLNDAQPVTATAIGGDYQLHDDRDNPDTTSAIVQYKDWNLNFESSVLSIHDDPPSVYFEGTEGTLNITREGYVFTPNSGTAMKVDSSENLSVAHTRNFLDGVVRGEKVNAPLRVGIEATVPVQMAVHSYWEHKIITRSELG